MSLVDAIVAQVLMLETALYHAYARMEARTDSEALHDLRINLRRMRSLLRPLRKIGAVATLNEVAAEVGKLTTPVRDLEVLIDELEQLGFAQQANARKAILQSSYSRIVASSTLKQLFSRLDQWPSDFRAAERGGELRQIKKTIAKRLHKQVERLKAALADPQYDLHQLRILVKRTRYATDAYPQFSPISVKAAASLKAVQSALGTWHDHYQWCLKAGQEEDLQPLLQDWHVAATAALMEAEVELLHLAALLAKNQQA
ncbi:CHAD domain-containing protein [Pseudomonas cavernicola]|uniref:CHAD domain-containing protein n=1 Tax=Pseudomonas cavernicola TaxID=2320866 RepID=A0A418XED8_9PSED|nr:CHAD domain-containing protein [Pseudomonas cavernicola]RJG10869.1 CHAD domain-containing protein [Pseudomonas cavernicola]